MDLKLVGSIMLIVGTSIGAGMLALPVVTANLGFIGSLILYFSVWFVMTTGAFLSLEVNLWLPQNSNLISMAKSTIGLSGQSIAWVTYLLLLYSLLCAYISGGSDLLQHLMMNIGINTPMWFSAVIFTIFFGFIVYMGIRSVDYINRGLMFTKLAALFLLIALLAPFISSPQLATINLPKMTNVTAIMVTITSFGYAIIVPSLRTYYNDNIAQLRKAIFVGSLIPLFCYIAWSAAIIGVIPLNGDDGLLTILQSNNPSSRLVDSLTTIASTSSVSFFIRLFTSICMATSFLGVSLCLTDFLADGFRLKKQGASNLMVQLLTFLPPLVIVLFFPGIFVQALEHAGACCVILLVFYPAIMAWRGRYHTKIAKGYMVIGGKILPGILIIFSFLMLMQGFKQGFLWHIE